MSDNGGVLTVNESVLEKYYEWKFGRWLSGHMLKDIISKYVLFWFIIIEKSRKFQNNSYVAYEIIPLRESLISILIPLK